MESVLKELAQLASRNKALKSHLDSKADKSYLLQVSTITALPVHIALLKHEVKIGLVSGNAYQGRHLCRQLSQLAFQCT